MSGKTRLISLRIFNVGQFAWDFSHAEAGDGGVAVKSEATDAIAAPTPGLAGWLLERWHQRTLGRPRLALVERISLAPRQQLALVEADGRRILVATSPEGSPSFYPLDGGEAVPAPPVGRVARRAKADKQNKARVSW